jgi:hypothetical protein
VTQSKNGRILRIWSEIAEILIWNSAIERQEVCVVRIVVIQ